MKQRDVDIVAFHWPLLLFMAMALAFVTDWANASAWASLVPMVAILGFIASYVYVVFRIMQTEPRPWIRFAWMALYLGIWPIGGPVCYWSWFRKQTAAR